MASRTNRHEQILDAAEALFSARGYDSVRLSDIASVVGVKHSAIYYYAPEGKEQLYVQVMERGLHRHQRGMAEAVAAASPDLFDQLWAVVDWLLAHPPLNVARMEQSDFPALSDTNARRLGDLLFESLRQPLGEALAAAKERGEIAVPNADMAALAFIALIQTVHATTHPFLRSRKRETIASMIDMLLQGWLPR